MTYSYVALGSNAGCSRRHLRAARQALKRLPGARLTATGGLYQSAPLGCPGRQRVYYNTAAELQTALPPPRLFLLLRKLEARIQKKRRAKNAPRRLDADYIAHGGCRLKTRRLTLPHARLFGRRFVLQPLADILAAAEADGAARRGCINRQAVASALRQCRRQMLWRIY